jgi:hypothetical protein
MEEKCFNHKTKKAADRCKFCGKSFCKECLILTGELKSVICKSCYKISTEKGLNSISRRKVYILVAALVGLFFLWDIFFGKQVEFLGQPMGNPDLTYDVLLLIGLIAITAINIVRIKQVKKFLKSEKYK